MSSKTINLNKHGEIKWNTTIFMIIFHVGIRCGPIHAELESGAGYAAALVDIGQFGHRHGIPPAVDASRL